MRLLASIIAVFTFFSLTQAQNCPILSFDNVIGAPGDTVEVTMYLQDISPLLGFQGTVVYDPDILSFIDLSEGSAFDDDFRVAQNEPFIGTGEIIVLGNDVYLQGVYHFQTRKDIAKLQFAVIGELGQSSEIEFNDQLSEVAFVGQDNFGNVIGLDPCGILPGSVSIGTPPPPSDFEVNVSVVDAICNQTTLGSITATGLFGVPPYTFSWTGPNGFSSTDQNITDLLPGIYDLIATDSDAGTVVINDIEVQEVGGEFAITFLAQQNYCDTGTEGFINTNIDFNNTGADLSYLWNTGQTTEDISDLSNGVYILTVADNVGCSQVHEFEIESTRSIEVIFHTEALCQGDSSGYIYPEEFPSPLNGNLNYYWSTGAVTDSLDNISAGTYHVTIEEPQGCLQVRTVEVEEIMENSDLVLDVTCSSMGLDNGSIFPSFTGDLAGTTVSAEIYTSSGDFIFDVDFAPGTYTVLGTSINGCQYLETAIIEESLSDFTSEYYSCMLDSIQFETSSNNPNLLYSWIPDSSFVIDSVPNPIFLDAEFANPTFTATLLTSSAQGCTRSFDFTVIQQDDCVWPGDTNEDNIVSASDLLYIGIANGSVGPARPNPLVTDWTAKPSTLWNDNIGQTALDKMFADCNGDGQINDDDIQVVEQNNGLSHLSFTDDLDLDRNMGAPLFVRLDQNYLENVSNDIGINLGAVDNQLLDAYGIAFQIKYDPAVTSIEPMSLDEKGWLSADGETIWDVAFLYSDAGILDVALTRTNGVAIGGFGTIGLFTANFTGDQKSEIEFDIINAVLLNAEGVNIPVQTMATTSVIGVSSTPTLQVNLYNESVFPNPSSDFIQVKSDRFLQKYNVYNSIGQLIKTGKPNQDRIDINLLISGLYIVQLEGPDGITSHRLVVE